MKIVDLSARQKRDDRDKSLWFTNRKNAVAVYIYRRRNSLSLCARAVAPNFHFHSRLTHATMRHRPPSCSHLRASDSPARSLSSFIIHHHGLVH